MSSFTTIFSGYLTTGSSWVVSPGQRSKQIFAGSHSVTIDQALVEALPQLLGGQNCQVQGQFVVAWPTWCAQLGPVTLIRVVLIECFVAVLKAIRRLVQAVFLRATFQTVDNVEIAALQPIWKILRVALRSKQRGQFFGIALRQVQLQPIAVGVEIGQGMTGLPKSG